MGTNDFPRYSVSATGEIWDYDKRRPVKTFKSNEYLQCVLFDKEGKKHVFGVHTVVAMFHCLDYFPGCVVHHVDEDKHNNAASNLCCMTRSKHSAMHYKYSEARFTKVKSEGPWNKGKKMSEEFREHCRLAALRRHHG
jgi:hypothetical protein